MSKYAEHDAEGVEHVEAELKAAWADGWDAIVPSALTPDAQSNRNGLYVPLYQVQKRLAEGAPQKIPADIEVIGSYPEDIDGGHRWWWSGGNWLYPGDVVAVFKLADSQSMNSRP